MSPYLLSFSEALVLPAFSTLRAKNSSFYGTLENINKMFNSFHAEKIKKSIFKEFLKKLGGRELSMLEFC